MQAPDLTSTLIAEAVSRLGWLLGITVGVLVVAIVGLVTLGRHALDTWLQRRAGIVFDKQLANHQSALDTALEARRAEFQTDLATHTSALGRQLEEVRHFYHQQQQQFERYAGQQHIVYPRLYRRLKVVEGLLVERFIETVPAYAQFSRESLQSTAKTARIEDHNLAPILAKLDAGDRRGAAADFEQAVRTARRGKALRDLQRARNYAIVNELFLSNAVRAAFRAVNEAFGSYEARVRMPEPGQAVTLYHLGAEIAAKLATLREIMGTELTGTPRDSIASPLLVPHETSGDQQT